MFTEWLRILLAYPRGLFLLVIMRSSHDGALYWNGPLRQRR